MIKSNLTVWESQIISKTDTGESYIYKSKSKINLDIRIVHWEMQYIKNNDRCVQLDIYTDYKRWTD